MPRNTNPKRKRALMIARTETTGALNAGHEAARLDLYEAGLIIGKEWLTIGDRRVRRSHQALAGKVAVPKEMFSVGGFPAPWRGYCGLPGDQRIRCRCTTVSVFPTS